MRVKGGAPGSKTTYSPFPGYEEQIVGSTTTRRATYTIAGQAVALRVQVVGGSNTRYYLHSDHLGSTSLATTTSGSLVAGSTSRYTPFGNWRTEPTANLTDRGFTGHRHHNLGSGAEDIGLVYMAARWYAPTLGRFISADTIVPNPAVSQSWNRYSYVRNSPIVRIDPTGHMDDCDCDGGGSSTTQDPETPNEEPLDIEQESPNPTPATLVFIGIPLTVAIVTSEIALTAAEIVIAPFVPEAPVIAVPLEILLGTTSLALLDIDIAYWSYTYRVIDNPQEQQKFELIPPWGLDD